MATQLLEQLASASNGLFGLLLVIALMALRAKDRELKEKNLELKAEMQCRVEDAQQLTKVIMEQQKEIIQTVNSLRQIIEWIEGDRPPRRKKEKEEPRT